MFDPPTYPKYRCRRCEDWGTLVAPDGRGTMPCPEPVHRPASATPITDPTTGEESENRDHDDDGR